MSKRIGIAALAILLAGCGGGNSANNDSTPTPTPASDPLAAFAWHLNNTGPTQVMSAFDNSDAVAGTDANVASVHQEGAGITGKGVTIAIVDSGLEVGHEDLRANMLADKSFNFLSLQADPSPPTSRPGDTRGDHGTGVAGVAAAKGWNNLGSRGLAPNASLVGYAPLELVAGVAEILSFGGAAELADEVEGDELALLTAFGTRSDGVDIFNYSAGSDYASPQQDPTAPTPQTLAAEFGTRKLRGDKGAIYLQAAGNEFIGSPTATLQSGATLRVHCIESFKADGLITRFSNAAAGHSCMNTNHEPQGQPYFMKVAAIAVNGKAAPYSSAGASNWITGFGGEDGIEKPAIVSTDDSGCSLGANSTASEASIKARFNKLIEQLPKLVANLFGRSPNDPNCNYTGTMNGTSAATPSLAGITALVLEANPALNWLDVKYILAKTARKVDAGIAAGAQAVTYTPAGASQTMTLSDPWVTNEGGFHFQSRYGFGLVDSAAAVAMAKAYAAPASRRVTPVTSTAYGAFHATNLPAAAGNVAVIEQASTFAAGGVSGPIQVDLVLTNTTGRAINPGSIQFELHNATTRGRSIVLPAYGAWYVGGKKDLILPKGQQKFRFFSNAFYGDSLSGAWTVKLMLMDGAANESSTFDAATLTGVALTSHGF